MYVWVCGCQRVCAERMCVSLVLLYDLSVHTSLRLNICIKRFWIHLFDMLSGTFLLEAQRVNRASSIMVRKTHSHFIVYSFLDSSLQDPMCLTAATRYIFSQLLNKYVSVFFFFVLLMAVI